MEKKKTKKKWREIRSAVTMMCVMAAMLSTATYAWFSLTSSPVVTGLEMTAASSDGLKISKDGTTWHNAIDMGDDVDEAAIPRFTLMPATLVSSTLTGNVPAFLKPKYSGNAVVDTEAIAAGDLNSYVASCSFFLKSEGAEVTVGILTVDPDDVTGDKGVTNGNPNEEGSFVKIVEDGDSDTNDHSAIEAARIALVVDGSMYIYEPNAGTPLKGTSSYATNSLTSAPLVPNVISSFDNGNLMSYDASAKTYSENTPATKTSGGLFNVGTTAKEVTMYVWFEGQDPQCVDQIMKDAIEAQIQFTVVQ